MRRICYTIVPIDKKYSENQCYVGVSTYVGDGQWYYAEDVAQLANDVHHRWTLLSYSMRDHEVLFFNKKCLSAETPK